MPKGAFYAFPNVSGLFGKRAKGGVLRGSADVCAFLLDEARIATVAGRGLRLRRPHPPLVRDRARHASRKGCAGWPPPSATLEG